MSFIFDTVQPVISPFVVHHDAQDSDTLLVPSKLWLRLSPSSIDKIFVAVSPVMASSTCLAKRPACLYWAILDEEAQEVVVPPSWLSLSQPLSGYASNTPSKSHMISIIPVHSPPLTEVFITALSDTAYATASTRKDVLEGWFTQNSRILRQNAVYTPDLESSIAAASASSQLPGSVAFRVDMTCPALQGYARQGSTKFIISSPDADPDPKIGERGLTRDDASEYAAFEIDEEFLASSCLAELPNGSEDLGAASSLRSGSSKDVLFQALSEPLHDDEDDCAIYLHVGDLIRVGVLSGDWAVSYSIATNERRLVRVIAADELLKISVGNGRASPMLLFNLSQIATHQARVSLLPSPFGSAAPSIPTARSVTIARIASALSTDRVYQSLFLHALRRHFEGKRRLVKKGDVIALGIDTDLAWRTPDSDSKPDETNGDEQEVNHDLPFSPHVTNEVVYFIVTNAEHSVVANGHTGPSPDLAFESRTGELGFWVDPNITRIIQTGLEQSRIPDVGTYILPSKQSPRALLGSLQAHPNASLLSPKSPFGQLQTLVTATSVERAVDYNLNLSILLNGPRGSGKVTVANWVAQRLGFHLLEINCFNLLGESEVKTEGVLRARFDKAIQCAPCLLVLRHLEALAQTSQVLESGKEPAIVNALKECFDQARSSWKTTGFPVVIVGTTSEASRVPVSVLANFKHEIVFEAPAELERFEILQTLLAHTAVAPDVSLASLATQTAALVAADLVSLVDRAHLVALGRVHGSGGANIDLPLTANDFDTALNKARSAYSETIGAPKIPNVTWDDVGGLAHVKSDILDTIQLPLEHPELFQDGLKKRSGILLYGPPGTGKTLLAKAVATSCSLNFFSVKGPELLNMYIGESEANVRRVFQRARDAKPCVIFFDELDSVAPKRGNHGDSGGVMDRIVSQLLAELDGMSSGQSGADVFVIGATNRPDLLDPALLRPGRFDRMLYLGVSDTHEAQFNILQALTRKFRLDPDLDLRSVAEKCPFNYTGADFYALCSDAMLGAMSRKAEELEAKIAELNSLPGPYAHPHPLTPQYYLAEMASAQDIEVLVSQADFDLALHNLVPSVSQSEMDHYATVQQRFSGQKKED
ncbi:hypothetical protein HGRIS_013359 [Hohenbuehelia grisea]|uniref:Peroxisomal ATPase PEX6 n=1 Tax=Hohenbuehelia grisea TaxID=104357 RepID=A0ABR3IVD7_9AGAR